jgi:hypothetical protein
MKLSIAVISLLATTTEAFSPSHLSPKTSPATKTTELSALPSNKNDDNVFAKACATAAMTCFLWGAPAIMAEQAVSNHILPTDNVPQFLTAQAKDMASASGSRVNKDADSLLRLGLPINNKQVRDLVYVLAYSYHMYDHAIELY